MKSKAKSKEEPERMENIVFRAPATMKHRMEMAASRDQRVLSDWLRVVIARVLLDYTR